MREASREPVVFNQAIRLQHAAEDETVEQLLAGFGEIRNADIGIAKGKAVGDDQPPALEVGEESFVEVRLLLLVVYFVNAVGIDVFQRQQLPELLAARNELL